MIEVLGFVEGMTDGSFAVGRTEGEIVGLKEGAMTGLKLGAIVGKLEVGWIEGD